MSEEIEIDYDSGLDISSATEEEEEEEEEEKRPSTTSRSDYISKHDVFLVLGTAITVLFLYHMYQRHHHKKDEVKAREVHHHHYPSSAGHHHEEEKEEGDSEGKLREEIEEETSHGMPKHAQIKRKRKRGNYFVDAQGEAHLEPVSTSENWVIKRDGSGHIIDAYRISDSYWTQ